MLTGGLLGFARALGEFGAIVLVSRQHPPQDSNRCCLFMDRWKGAIYLLQVRFR
jgi:ABC-type sulfate transport system permease component